MPQQDALQAHHELEKVQVQISELYNHIDILKGAENKHKSDLEDAKGDHLIITDHAMVRYLERCNGVSFDHVREEMSTPAALMLGRSQGSGVIPIGDGGKARIQNGVMLTVIDGNG